MPSRTDGTDLVTTMRGTLRLAPDLVTERDLEKGTGLWGRLDLSENGLVAPLTFDWTSLGCGRTPNPRLVVEPVPNLVVDVVYSLDMFVDEVTSFGLVPRAAFNFVLRPIFAGGPDLVMRPCLYDISQGAACLDWITF